jgi:DNA-binding SARP family transcriptional activator
VIESAATFPTPSRISLSLIRDFELRHRGELVELSPNSQRLVCFLAFQDGAVPRSYVSGRLWFSSDEYRASASLRSALWRLRSMPGLDLVGSSYTHIWLQPSVSIDIRQVIERGMAVLSEPHCDSELINVARELVSIGDDVLVGWYDDWVSMERERFRQIRLHLLDRIGDQLLDQERFCDALQIALAAICAEPLRESAHRLLIRMHLREGNVAEAIRQYRSYADLLRRELHATPSPVIQRLLSPYLARS